MTEQQAISQRLPDGTVDVWLDGWHICFPPEDARPTAERAAQPTPPEHPTAGLEATAFAAGRAVRHGPWIVAVTESDFTVIPTDPEENATHSPYRHRYFKI